MYTYCLLCIYKCVRVVYYMYINVLWILGTPPCSMRTCRSHSRWTIYRGVSQSLAETKVWSIIKSSPACRLMPKRLESCCHGNQTIIVILPCCHGNNTRIVILSCRHGNNTRIVVLSCCHGNNTIKGFISYIK